MLAELLTIALRQILRFGELGKSQRGGAADAGALQLARFFLREAELKGLLQELFFNGALRAPHLTLAAAIVGVAGAAGICAKGLGAGGAIAMGAGELGVVAGHLQQGVAGQRRKRAGAKAETSEDIKPAERDAALAGC